MVSHTCLTPPVGVSQKGVKGVSRLFYWFCSYMCWEICVVFYSLFTKKDSVMKIQYDLLQEKPKKKMRPSKKELLVKRYLRMGLDRFRAEQLANYNQ